MSDLRILTSHPVQYQVPFFRALAALGLEIEVGYYHQGAAGHLAYDPGFGFDMEWDVDLLSGYTYHTFVHGRANYDRREQIRIAPRLLTWALRRQTPLLLLGWFTEISWVVWLLRIMRRAPVLVMSETTPLSFATVPKPGWRVALLRWLLQHSSACLFIGQHNRDFLKAMGVTDERLFHAPYSIDNERFASESLILGYRRRELCRQYGLDAELPVFLFCGKLIPLKRAEQLLEAYLVAGLHNQAQLLYIGEGRLRPELERRIQEVGLKHVHLLGFFNQSQMPLAYVLGQVLCLISEGETWGLVVNEALACGRPVIVTEAVGCAPDLVGPDNGWVVPLDNHRKLAETLRCAFEQREVWPEMGQAGRKKVGGHTFEAMAAGVKAALRTIRDE